MARSITKTVSAKKIVGDIWKHLPKDASGEYIEHIDVPLFQVRGEVKSIEKVVSIYGENWGFAGSFEAYSEIDGEITSGMKCYLPDVATSLIKDAFEELPEGGTVLFAFAIGARFVTSAKGPGYEYTVHEMMDNKMEVNSLDEKTTPFRISGRNDAARIEDASNVTPLASDTKIESEAGTVEKASSRKRA